MAECTEAVTDRVAAIAPSFRAAMSRSAPVAGLVQAGVAVGNGPIAPLSLNARTPPPVEPETERTSAAPATGVARALDAHPQVVSANAIKLLMLTGARRGEVLNAT